MPRITPRSEEELILARQRRNMRVLSRKIKSGEPLNDEEQWRAAAVIKAWADQCMNWQPPKRKPGREASVDPNAVAIRYMWLIHGDESGANKVKPSPAIDMVAEEFGLSITRVKDIIAERGDGAEITVAGYVTSRSKKPSKI